MTNVLDPTRDQVITVFIEHVPAYNSKGHVQRIRSSQGHAIVGDNSELGAMVRRIREHNPQSYARLQIVNRITGETSGLFPLHDIKESQ